MPYMQAAIGHLNKILGDPRLLREQKQELLELFRPVEDLDGARENLMGTFGRLLGDEGPAGAIDTLDSPDLAVNLMRGLPPTIMDAGRAVIYRNLQRSEPFGMTFAWAPAYEHELTVWESPPTTNSPGWITVLIKGRYPTDQHPVTDKRMDELWG